MNAYLPRLKICGIQVGDDLSFTAHDCVHYVGIVFVKKSRRYVDPIASNAIVRDAQCPAVGVFSDASVDDVVEVAKASGINVAQLHGSESAQMCQQLNTSGLKVWKAIAVAGDGSNVESVRADIERFRNLTDALLLDTKPVDDRGVTGGHGKAFDWRVLKQLKGDLQGVDWWVAGGIRPENVTELLALQCPNGIDVSSGVETDGRKDSARISQLMEAVVHS